jgi:uncharacterized membrane protein
VLQRRLLGLCIALSAVSLALIILVPRVTGGPRFDFLVWNLVLAWVPLIAALALHDVRRAALLTQLPLLGLWLAFFPNAPYLVTDLIHVRHRDGALSLARDLVTFGSTALAGLALGFSSLILVERTLRRRFGARGALTASMAAIAAASVGIYLGRVIRLNSWDLLLSPRAVAEVTQDRFLDVEAHPLAVLGTVAVALALVVTYLAFRRIAQPEIEGGRSSTRGRRT